MALGDDHRPLRDQVLDELRRQILDGELVPGTMLNESALATDLGVSRLPVREAIRQLESMGLLTAVPRRGVKVAEVDRNEVETVHQIRTALETLAVRRTMERRDDVVMEQLRALLGDGKRAEHDGDGPTLNRLNSQFHDLLAQGSGSAILQTLLRTVRHQSEYLAGGKHSPMELSWEEHAEIVEAVLAGRTRDATTLMRRHLSERHSVSTGSVPAGSVSHSA
jgi:DNA-binding GntR family transcriptional regulator